MEVEDIEAWLQEVEATLRRPFPSIREVQSLAREKDVRMTDAGRMIKATYERERKEYLEVQVPKLIHAIRMLLERK